MKLELTLDKEKSSKEQQETLRKSSKDEGVLTISLA